MTGVQTCALPILLLRPSVLILASHGAIAAALSRLRSPRGRRKAASTCASHLAVTFLHHGCPTFTYVRPKASYSPRQDRTLAMVYTNITPLLYPLIYSLRNRKITVEKWEPCYADGRDINCQQPLWRSVQIGRASCRERVSSPV